MMQRLTTYFRFGLTSDACCYLTSIVGGHLKRSPQFRIYISPIKSTLRRIKYEILRRSTFHNPKSHCVGKHIRYPIYKIAFMIVSKVDGIRGK